MPVSIVGDLKGLHKKLNQLKNPALERVGKKVGEALVSSTIQRFNGQHAPDGTKWQRHAAVTVTPRAKDYRKNGALRKGIRERMETRKILIDSARLRNSISFKAVGTKVHVGTNVKYARIHQKGGMAGRGKKVRIPARPFLGVSSDDKKEVRRLVLKAVQEGDL
jgi:phage virion morphogenesis protein